MTNLDIIKQKNEELETWEDCIAIIPCTACKHFSIRDENNITGFCRQYYFEYLVSGTDPNNHFCAWGELRKEHE